MFSSAASPGGPETTSDSHFSAFTKRPASQCRRRRLAGQRCARKWARLSTSGFPISRPRTLPWKPRRAPVCQNSRGGARSISRARAIQAGLCPRGDLALAKIFFFTCRHCNARVSRASGDQAARVYRGSETYVERGAAMLKVGASAIPVRLRLREPRSPRGACGRRSIQRPKARYHRMNLPRIWRRGATGGGLNALRFTGEARFARASYSTDVSAILELSQQR